MTISTRRAKKKKRTAKGRPCTKAERDLYYIDAEDKEFNDTLKNARKKSDLHVDFAVPCTLRKTSAASHGLALKAFRKSIACKLNTLTECRASPTFSWVDLRNSLELMTHGMCCRRTEAWQTDGIWTTVTFCVTPLVHFSSGRSLSQLPETGVSTKTRGL